MLSPVASAIGAVIVNDSELNTFLLTDMFRTDARLRDLAGLTHIVTNTRMLLRFLNEKAQPESIRLMMLDYHLPGGSIAGVLPTITKHHALAPGAVLIGWSSDPDRADEFARLGASGFIAKTRGFDLLPQDIAAIAASAAGGQWLSLF